MLLGNVAQNHLHFRETFLTIAVLILISRQNVTLSEKFFLLTVECCLNRHELILLFLLEYSWGSLRRSILSSLSVF